LSLVQFDADERRGFYTLLGGASRNVRRPDLVPGVDPFITSGGLLFLNAAAFASPLPGTVGNLQRGSLHGPGFAQLDVVIAKKFDLGGPAKFELRTESSICSTGQTSTTRWRRSRTRYRRAA
jgi:hypothetical protein